MRRRLLYLGLSVGFGLIPFQSCSKLEMATSTSSSNGGALDLNLFPMPNPSPNPSPAPPLPPTLIDTVTGTLTGTITGGPAPTPAPPPPPPSPGVRLVGRFDRTDSAGPKFNWPASTIEADFVGTELSATLWQQSTVDQIQFTVVIDDGQPWIVHSNVGPAAKVKLASELSSGQHHIKLVRNSEGLFGLSQFLGFDAGVNGRILPPPPARALLMEFLGDSLTAGFGSLGTDPNCQFSVETESAYASYASVTGRALGADVSIVAISGIGVHRNLAQPAGADPTLYAHYDFATKGGAPHDFSIKGAVPYDFGSETKTPDIVVINLGTNDYGEGPPDAEAFITDYRRMIAKVRMHRPKAKIFCGTLAVLADVLSTDRKTVRTTVQTAVDRTVADGDPNVFWVPLFSPARGQGLGCGAHLSAAQNEEIANNLVAAIRAH